MKIAFSKKNLWEATPRWLRVSLSSVLPHVPQQWLLGQRFRRVLRFARDAQWWPRERVETYQLRKLRHVLELACEHTPYYRDSFQRAALHPRDVSSLHDIRALPTINKQDIVEHLDAMCVRDCAGRDVDLGSTGGTNGEPLRFYMPAHRSAIEYAYLIASWERVGFELGSTMAVLRGKVVKPDRKGLRHEYDPLLRHHYYSSFHMTDENMGRYLDHMETIGPLFLHVYPSTVAALAKFIKRTGRKPPSGLRGIISESEIVYPEQRKLVQEALGHRIFSCYGQSEKVVLACGCEHSDDYHVWPTYGYFELLDEEGNPVTTPGQRGEIVGTSFINTVMPFIRYRTGDYATYVADHCEACGRQHTIIRDIRGHRTQEYLVARNGAQIPWVAMNMHDDTFLNVRQFQFHQDKPGEAELRIVPAGEFGEAQRKRILAGLAPKLDGQLTLRLKTVSEIKLSPRGKAIYVDQQIPQDA